MVHQTVGTLSAANARACAGRHRLAAPNLLLLDEPTNHLDLTTREALSMALNEFEGTVMLVSHDRAMLREVCDESGWSLAAACCRSTATSTTTALAARGVTRRGTRPTRAAVPGSAPVVRPWSPPRQSPPLQRAQRGAAVPAARAMSARPRARPARSWPTRPALRNELAQIDQRLARLTAERTGTKRHWRRHRWHPSTSPTPAASSPTSAPRWRCSKNAGSNCSTSSKRCRRVGLTDQPSATALASG